MAVSVVSASQVANWFTATSPQTVGSLAWSSGDVIIVVGTGESATLAVLATPTNASLTFSLRASVTTGGSTEAPAYIWSAVAGSAQSGQTVSMANSGGGMFGLAVWVLSGASGSFANASANQTESGFTFTPTSGSGVVYGYGDWAATSGKTIATATGTPTERYDTTNSTNYGVYGGDWMGVAASSATFGITSYAGMTVAHAVVEVLASAAGEAPPAIGSPSRHGPGHRRGPLGRMDLLRAYHHRRYSTEIGGAATFPVDVTDSSGLTDSVDFVQQLERSDSVGLTDSTALTEALVRTDDAGLTDSATQALVKSVDQTDPVGLTDTVAFTESLVRTDSAGLTDSALLQQELVRTDSAGLTDSSVVQVVKAVTADDPAGLTDTTAFSEQLVRTDLAGLTDQAALTEQLVRTDSAGLTDTSAAGLLRDIAQTDLVGLTDVALFAELLIRTDLVGLTDTVQTVGGSATAKAGRIVPGTRAFAGIEPGLLAGVGAEPGTRGSAAVITGSRAGAQIEPATKTGPSIEGGG